MKDEVLYFLAEMTVAFVVVDAFIPRAEHYMKTKHSSRKMERSKLHQYSDRLNTNIPDKDKVHMHPPHFQHHPHATTFTDQHVGAVLTYALSGTSQYQDPGSFLDEQEREKKTINNKDAISGAFVSHPSIESTAWKAPFNHEYDFFRHP